MGGEGAVGGHQKNRKMGVCGEFLGGRGFALSNDVFYVYARIFIGYIL